MRVRTGYSFRNSAGRISDVMSRLVEIGAGVAPITDRASTFGFYRWSQMAKKNDLKPVFGIELAVSPNPAAKKPAMDHWTFIAKDSLTPIHELLNLATSQFRYEPLLTYTQAQNAEGVFKIVGKYSDAELIDPRTPDLYYELSPSISNGQFKRFKEMGLRPVKCSDNKYPRQEDYDFYEVAIGRGASSQTYPQHLLSTEEWRDSLPRSVEDCDIEQAIASKIHISSESNAEMKKGVLLSPERPDTLENMCIAGAAALNCDLTKKEYRDRLTRELGLIQDKDFEDYFYIIADICQWARARMIVGPARGSSCGSLVCYLLGITTIDPLQYGLIFERFIDVNRDDLPDIDIDFSDQKRKLVFDYMEKKYGKEHVARLGAVAMFKPKSAIAEAGKAMSIPRFMCDNALDGLIERSSGDARALDTLKDTLETTPNGKKLLKAHPEIAVTYKMEGHPRHFSQHAAGVVLTELPVKNYVAVDARTGATHCDKKDAEALDLLKIDALGLTQLSVFEDALELAGLPHTFLEGIPLDDPKAFAVLNKNHFAGIFQFMGLALQRLAREVDITELDDIVAITALARPGPLTSGGAFEWVERHNKRNPITYPHPLFKPYLEDTRGIVLYQEQVMEIGREIGDLSWADVTALRKAMSKSLGKEFFDKFGDPFKNAAEKKGIPRDVLDGVWDDLCAYGAWAFNKSHSVAYGVISYQCCWLKAHYPLEFAAATLNHESDPAKQVRTLREMAHEGIGYIAADKDISGDKWNIGEVEGKRTLVGPASNVKGIGPKLLQEIVSCRREGRPIPARAEKLLTNPVTPIDTLWPVADRIKKICPDLRARNITSPVTKIDDIDESHKQDKDFLIIGVAAVINPRSEAEDVRVASRGGKKMVGPMDYLNLQIEDDTGIIYCKVSRYDFVKMGKPILDRGRPGKSIYAVKGRAMAGRRFLFAKGIRFIGDMEIDG